MHIVQCRSTVCLIVIYYFSTDAFLEAGLPLLRQLVEQGYILPATRILANITPRFFGQEKVLVKNEKLVQIGYVSASVSLIIAFY